MSFEPTWLFLSLIPAGVGFVLFVYGKKQVRWPHLAAGLAFMVYPYFATSAASLVVGGVALGVALWLAVRAGW
jgi:4-hydroxybenzoate polyprenyltransferase